MELSGCNPVSVGVLRNGKEEFLTLSDAGKENTNETELYRMKALILILDTFNISQEAYRELSAIIQSMLEVVTLYSI